MNAFSIALFLVPLFISLWVCDRVAKKKHLNRRYWQIMALIFGPFAIPFVFFGKPEKPKKDQ